MSIARETPSNLDLVPKLAVSHYVTYVILRYLHLLTVLAYVADAAR